MSAKGMTHIVEALEGRKDLHNMLQMMYLEQTKCSNNHKVGDEGVAIFCNYVINHASESFKNLTFDCVKMTDQGLKSVAELIKNSRNLEFVNVSKNYFKTKDIGVEMCEAMKNNTRIKDFKLMMDYQKRDSDSGSEFMQSFLPFLSENDTLEKLNLVNNIMENDTFVVLIDALSENDCLLEINFEVEKRTQKESYEKFVKMLEKNKRLRSIEIRCRNDVDDLIAKVLMDIMEKNGMIQEIFDIKINVDTRYSRISNTLKITKKEN